MAILTPDSELKIMLQKNIVIKLQEITYEQSLHFSSYYDERAMSFFLRARLCGCPFCYFPYQDCKTVEEVYGRPYRTVLDNYTSDEGSS